MAPPAWKTRVVLSLLRAHLQNNDRSVKRTLTLLLTVALLVITTHRLPAPISEVPETTPAPTPRRGATPRAKPKPETTPKPTPSHSLAGTWTGTTITKVSKGGDSSATYIIRISDDEKTVWINWGSQQPSGAGHQAPANRSRETLSWSLTLPGFDLNVIDVEMPEYLVMDTLRMNANGTASFVREGTYPSHVNFWTGGPDPGITFKCTGTLSRQDASSAPPIPQTTTSSSPTTTTTTVAPQTSGLPTARPVPNRPGFVYNPFDPNSPILLDVRGKASGTKVKDPFSGKLFVVP
jgi:hypothetical protein